MLEALQRAEGVLAARLRLLGLRHPKTVSAVALIADVQSKLGKAEEAVDMGRHAVTLSSLVYGDGHHTTLAFMNNYANYLSQLGEAVDTARAALEGQIHRLGSNHPDTFRSQVKLACKLRQLVRREDALVLAAEANAGQQQALAADHRDTIASAHLIQQLQLELQQCGGRKGVSLTRHSKLLHLQLPFCSRLCRSD